VWRQQAENVCESLTRGSRVIVTGWLKQRTYETKEGDKRTVLEVEADDVAASLKFASAKVTKVARSGGRQSSGSQGSSGGGDSDPWAVDYPGRLLRPAAVLISLRDSTSGR